jgi:hypothetical protein
MMKLLAVAVTVALAHAASLLLAPEDASSLGKIEMISANWSTPEDSPTDPCIIVNEEYDGSDIMECTKEFYLETNATSLNGTVSYHTLKIDSTNEGYAKNGRFPCLDDFSTDQGKDAIFSNPSDPTNAEGFFYMDPTPNVSNAVPIELVAEPVGNTTVVKFTAVIEGTNCEATFKISCGEAMGDKTGIECAPRPNPAGQDDSDNMQTGAIVGIAVGAILVIGVVGAICYRSRVGYDRLA